MIRRHPLLFLFVLGLLAALAWAWQNRIHLAAFPAIIGAYTAKEYCSCRYVMGNSADYCRAYTQQYVPISGFFDDEARRRVTARGLGSTQTAAWLGPPRDAGSCPRRTGCRTDRRRMSGRGVRDGAGPKPEVECLLYCVSCCCSSALCCRRRNGNWSRITRGSASFP
ncbi:hypothetical protein K652_06073 [Pseudomonas aeruginosa VRFPA02]|nr:hypothetical protein K652_06073 [Pseudomonas aeruginosa VRFPA02]